MPASQATSFECCRQFWPYEVRNLSRPTSFDQLRVEAVDPHLEAGALAFLLEVLVHVLLDLLHHLLDARRVDAAVGDEPLERQPRHLAAERVVARDEDRLRRVVDDQVHAGGRLERPDVAPLSPDDPALHVVGREIHDRDGGLDGVVRRQALDRRGEHFAGLALGVLPGFLLQAHRDQDRVPARLLLHLGEQPLLGLLGGESGHALQGAALLLDEGLVSLLQLLDRPLPVGELLLLGVIVPVTAVELVQPAGHLLFLLDDPALHLLDLALALLDLLLELHPRLVDDLLGLDGRVLQPGLAVPLRLFDQTAGLFGSLSDLPVGQRPLEQQTARAPRAASR